MLLRLVGQKLALTQGLLFSVPQLPLSIAQILIVPMPAIVQLAAITELDDDEDDDAELDETLELILEDDALEARGGWLVPLPLPPPPQAASSNVSATLVLYKAKRKK
jgi:hypothetical protein